jgi:hypothetical protein
MSVCSIDTALALDDSGAACPKESKAMAGNREKMSRDFTWFEYTRVIREFGFFG